MCPCWMTTCDDHLMPMRLDSYRSDFNRGASANKETAWMFVRAVFFLTPLHLPGKTRARLLRTFGAKIGVRSAIKYGVDISFPWRVTMGDDVWIGDRARILSLAPVSIGSSVCISQEAYLCTGSHDHRKSTFDLITAPITIGDSVWIAARAFVCPGVTIGSGSVIGACSVVTRDIPAGVFASGNPARVIRECPPPVS